MRKNKLIITLAALLLIPCLLLGCGQKDSGEMQETSGQAVQETVPQETQKEMSMSELLTATLTLKEDLETALDEAKAENIASAREKIQGIAQKAETIRSSLAVTLDNLGEGVPALKKELINIQGMLDLVDVAAEELLPSVFDYLEANPLTDLRAGDGLNTAGLCEYVDFLETLMPDIESLVEQAQGLDLSLVDEEGKIAEYLETAKDLLDMYHADSAVFENLKDMLGANGDRVYLIAAQNSAEIRASGGFPGAMGTIRIEDGILTVEDFKTVYDVLSPGTPSQAQITTTETRLFHGGLSAPRDADYCPDFERVAYIWALGYENRQREQVDGVISVTPEVVQKLLAAMGEEVELIDGTVINGENAVKMLQYELYFKYYNTDYKGERNKTSDAVFADAAKKTMEKVMDNMDMGSLLDYLTIATEGFENRTVMLWMEDQEEQEILRKLKWNGGLNTDPQNPEAGIYYNCTIASKMGWFLLMDAQIGEGTRNEDGSYTYPMTVTFSNDITQEIIKKSTAGITGGGGGKIHGSAYFFAPAGGTVSDFVVSKNVPIKEEVYHDLALGHMQIFTIAPNEVVTVTYNLTTAPGVETPLQLSMTPTVQDYH